MDIFKIAAVIGRRVMRQKAAIDRALGVRCLGRFFKFPKFRGQGGRCQPPFVELDYLLLECQRLRSGRLGPGEDSPA